MNSTSICTEEIQSFKKRMREQRREGVGTQQSQSRKITKKNGDGVVGPFGTCLGLFCKLVLIKIKLLPSHRAWKTKEGQGGLLTLSRTSCKFFWQP